MPRIIRRALVEALLASDEVREALDDLSMVGGISVRFMAVLGQETYRCGMAEAPELCCWMNASEGGRQVCSRVIQGVMEGSVKGSCARLCPAGLWEAAIPVRMAGEILGYLMLGQVADKSPDTAQLNHWRHVLAREGLVAEHSQLERLSESVPRLGREKFAAVLRMARRTVRQLETRMERGFTEDERHGRIPGSIRKGLSYMRAHYQNPLTLADLARETGMSRQHFCTLFQRSTGMGFTHYLSWLRIEEVCRQLVHTDESITEIAYGSGFQSISQFNRIFRQIRKCSPRQYRREHSNG